MSVWDRLVGQDRVVGVLSRAAQSARATVAGLDGSAQRAMSQAWLITGPPGSGRSVAARAFAAALECTGPEPGCGECEGCRTALAGTHRDVLNFVTEGVQFTIKEVRDLVMTAQAAPSAGGWRVIIVEDADRMTERTSNVLLKAIEEPPARTVWLLCTPSAEDMLTTIRSRCRHLALRVPPAEAVADLLVRDEGADRQTALAAAREAQSHIGLARALVRDPRARARRRSVIETMTRVRSVGEAVLAAADLQRGAKEQADAANRERDEREQDALNRELGVRRGQRLAPIVRAEVKRLEQAQGDRAKRARRDVWDRALVDLLGFYRDVLFLQLGAGEPLINADMEPAVRSLAAESTLAQTMRRVDAIEVARRRIGANVQPLLALEAMAVALRPQE